ncbi:hypothetical protein ADUPG1_009514 [Aduncisulcus paluster]|uniref:Uncharacterized protein n=1 Tax=Aduncisulcus paluster TaxID=2918883 RepID=A0ABQ5KVX3_9EUKA|nr:hypothetical protein ADUPG1_009514 [Aduncisulcus paluster]
MPSPEEHSTSPAAAHEYYAYLPLNRELAAARDSLRKHLQKRRGSPSSSHGLTFKGTETHIKKALDALRGDEVGNGCIETLVEIITSISSEYEEYVATTHRNADIASSEKRELLKKVTDAEKSAFHARTEAREDAAEAFEALRSSLTRKTKRIEEMRHELAESELLLVKLQEQLYEAQKNAMMCAISKKKVSIGVSTDLSSREIELSLRETGRAVRRANHAEEELKRMKEEYGSALEDREYLLSAAQSALSAGSGFK